MSNVLFSLLTMSVFCLTSCGDDIEANKKPIAGFDVSNTSPKIDEEVTFTDTSTDEGGSVEKWNWNFGDNSTSTEQHPKHTFKVTGSFDVTLTVTDDKEGTGSSMVKVTVTGLTDAMPTSAFTVAKNLVLTGDEVQFTDASQDDNGVTAWAWDFGDNGTSTEQNPKHSYDKIGAYEVKLTVTDASGQTSESMQALKAGGIKWSFAVAGEIKSIAPAIADDGTIYVASDSKEGANNVHAINADGSTKWEYATGDVVRASPAIASDGTVYTASYDDSFYAFDGATGSVKWKYDLGNNAKYSSPTIATDGTIYIGSQTDSFYALKSNGTLKWESPTGGDVNGTAAIGTDGTVYVLSTDDNLYAFDPTNGTVKWTYLYGTWAGTSIAIDTDGTIFLAGENDGPGVIAAVNPDGTQKWKISTTGKIDQGGVALGSNGTVYVGTKTPELLAIDVANGSIKWSYTQEEFTGIGSNPAVDVNGNIYFGDDSGLFTVLDESGSKKLQFNLGSKVWSSPVIGDDGIVYIGATQGTKEEGYSGLFYAIEVFAESPAASAWPMKGKTRTHTGQAQ